VHCLCQTRNKGMPSSRREGPALATCTVHGQQQKGLLALMISSRGLGDVFLLEYEVRHEARAWGREYVDSQTQRAGTVDSASIWCFRCLRF
jgi:hypothetical protein